MSNTPNPQSELREQLIRFYAFVADLTHEEALEEYLGKTDNKMHHNRLYMGVERFCREIEAAIKTVKADNSYEEWADGTDHALAELSRALGLEGRDE